MILGRPARVLGRHRGLAVHVLGRAVFALMAILLIVVVLPAAIAAQGATIP